MAFFWSAFAAETASELASATAREFVSLAIGSDAQAAKSPEPHWITPNKVALEIGAVRLRDFSTGATGPATLVCAPFALHGATIVDFALRHSLVQALQGAGIERLFVTDWRPATPQMRFWCVDDYIAALNVVVDELGGGVSLIGLCQGGWMALMYAARFPDKIHKLVLAGAPIDVAADASKLTELANNTPSAIFKELVELGEGRLQGQHLLNFWAPTFAGEEEVHRALQSPEPINSTGFRQLSSRFREWYAWTLDLPGTYYLQVVEQLFKENRLARSEFVALGRRLDLSKVRCPLFLLAGSEDDIVVPEQLFATKALVHPSCREVETVVAPCGHLGLFMGRNTLSAVWPDISRWLLRASEV